MASFSKERRVVFLGRTGAGKSATGNNIFDENKFVSSVGSKSVTRKCQRGTVRRYGRDLQIIDTPGLFDTGMTNAEITREVTKCVGMTAPGPHAFVMVIRIDRFTKEEQDTVDHFMQVFGEDMRRHLFVLFTRKDDLINDGVSMEQYIQKVPDSLRNLLDLCGNRYVAFNNRASKEERDRDVRDFVAMVDKVFLDNEDTWYTSEMFEEAEKAMKLREEELRQQHQGEVNKLKEEVQREFQQRLQEQEGNHLDVVQQLTDKVAQLELEKKTAEEKHDKEDEMKKNNELAEFRSMIEEMHRGHKEEMQAMRQQLNVMKQQREDALLREKTREEINQGNDRVMEVLGMVGKTIFESVVRGVIGAVGDGLGGMIKARFDKKISKINATDDDKTKSSTTADKKEQAKKKS